MPVRFAAVTALLVVSDSSPPIYLSALSDLDLLPKLFNVVLIPPAVRIETVDQSGGLPGEAALRDALKAGWLRVSPMLAPAEPIEVAGCKLHWGKRKSSVSVSSCTPICF